MTAQKLPPISSGTSSLSGLGDPESGAAAGSSLPSLAQNGPESGTGNALSFPGKTPWVALSGRDVLRIADRHPETFTTALACWIQLLLESSRNFSLTFDLADATLAARSCVHRRTVLRVKLLLEGLGLASYISTRIKGLKNPPTKWTLTPSAMPFQGAAICDTRRTVSHTSLCDLSHTPSVSHEETTPTGNKQPRRGVVNTKRNGAHVPFRGTPGGAPDGRATASRRDRKFEPVRVAGSTAREDFSGLFPGRSQS